MMFFDILLYGFTFCYKGQTAKDLAKLFGCAGVVELLREL